MDKQNSISIKIAKDAISGALAFGYNGNDAPSEDHWLYDAHQAGRRIKELEQALHDRSSERDTAIGMLADWCVAVELNGASWDDWDEHCKNASFRPCGIRDLLDVAIYERKPMERKQ